MAPDAHESFVRWQGITRDYFTSVSNLVLGLATGLLAFWVSGRNTFQFSSKCLLVLNAGVLLPLSASISLAVWCAINRLNDFRATAKIARLRSKNEPVPMADRQEAKILGQLTWCLFCWQLVLFCLGAFGMAITVIAQLLA